MGCIDLLGNAYEAPAIATGYGSYLAVVCMHNNVAMIKFHFMNKFNILAIDERIFRKE